MSKTRSGLPMLAAAVLLAGCTATKVTPLKTTAERMCIEENPKVKVNDFVPVLQEGFARYGIETQLYRLVPRADCPYLVTYTARRSWDVTPYLSTAEITILGPQRQTLAKASYHLRGKGGLSPMKWQDTRSKINPLIDQLLAGAQAKRQAETADQARDPQKRLDKQLHELQKQNLSYDAYRREYQRILQEHGSR